MTMSDKNELNDDAWEEKDPNDAPLPKADADAGSEPDDRGASRRRRREPDLQPSDDRQKKALEFLTTVVREMEMECTVHLRRAREGNSVDEINLEIAGRDAGRIIGKKGQVLQAIQFLVHRVVNRPGIERRHILVDAEGYRSRRDMSLANMARRLGKQAVDEGKIITFEPMNPRDRRVVHLALAKFEGVITKSDGEGEQRRVQIIPVRRPSAVEPS